MKNIFKTNKSVIGALAVGAAATLWGVDGVCLTPNLFSLPVPFVVFVFHLLPFILMNIFFFKKYKKIKEFNKTDFLIILLIALLGGSLGTLAIVKALFLVHFKKLSAVILIQKLQPVFAIITARIILGEKISKKFSLWAGIALVSSYFLTFGLQIPVFNTGNNTTLAAIFSLFAAFSFGSSTALGRKMVQRFDFKTVAFYRYGFTTLIMFVFNLIWGSLLVDFSSTNLIHWKYFIVIALTTGSLALFIYYYGLTKIKAQIATFCELLFPITTVILDYFINGNTLSVVQLIAAVVLIGSILQVTKK